MRRNIFVLALGLAMAMALTGCTSNTAPAVTPTPANNTVAPTYTPGMESMRPDVTDDAQYDAGSNGQVEGTTPPAGTTARGMVNEAGDAVRDVGRGVENAVY